MTNFEKFGVDLQEDSHSPEILDRRFKRSCELCSTKGFSSGDCNRCPIALAHNAIKQGFEYELSIKMSVKPTKVEVASV